MVNFFYPLSQKFPKSAMICQMSNYLNEKLNSLNLEKLEKLFFALFLLSIPLQTRLTFLTPQTYLNVQFNEYATFFVYLSDIFLITTFLLYFVNPVQKFTSRVAGIILLSAQKYLHFINTNHKFSFGVNNLTKTQCFSIKFNSFYSSPRLIPIIFLTGFLLWAILSASWSVYPNIAIFQALKLAEMIFLALYISNRFFWFGLKKALFLIFITGTFQSLVGIGQYLFQRSLGLKILGESILATNLDNVAKIVVGNERILRAYGTFPHPNVLGAFLVLSIILGFYLIFTFKKKNTNQIVSRETILIRTLTFGTILQLTCFIMTFSRLAWTGLSIIIVLFFIYAPKLFYACPSKPNPFLKNLFNPKQDQVIVSRETILAERSGVKQFDYFPLDKAKKYALITIFISFCLAIIGLWSQINSRTIDTGNNYQQSIDYRVLYNSIATKIIVDHPLTGIGNGNFTLEMKKYSPITLDWWQYQPVHNIYLLTASELGIIGLILFLLFIFSLLKMAYLKQNNQIVSRETILADAQVGEKIPEHLETKFPGGNLVSLFSYLILSIFIGFLFMGLFDHYFWTLQQGRITFWLTTGIILALIERKN